MAVDSEVIEAVKRGEKDRYAELVVRYQRMVYGIAWSQLGDNDLCEEAAQETFVRAFRYLVALRHPERFGGWLARITRNVSTSLLRKHARELKGRERWRLESAHPHYLQPPNNEDQSLSGTLRHILTELPHAHRECLVLFYLEGKNIRETAEVLNISEAAVKTRLHRARIELRGCLEERLETSLGQLAPPRDLSLLILPLLPAVPFAAGLGASTVAGKVIAGLGQVASVGFLLITTLLQTAFVGALLAWYGKNELDNLAPGAGKQLRSRMLIRTLMTLFFMIVGITFLSQWASLRFGPLLVFQLLVPFCLWGFWRTCRMLRVNNSRFVWGQLLAVGTFGVTSFVIGFYDAPFWIFLGALLPLNIVLYETNKSKPARHDYNLFIRDAMGILGAPDSQPQTIQQCTPLQRKAFAQFLGRRFLISDFTLAPTGIRLSLPPVATGALMYLGVSGAKSVVTIDESAVCSAQLGRRDLRDLTKFCNVAPTRKADLEQSVARVVQSAFQRFLKGDTAAVEVLLDTASDEHIFVTPVAKSRVYRIVGLVSMVASIVAIAMFATLSPPFHLAKPVSQSVAAQSMLAWSASTPPAGDFNYVMYASVQPSPAFFGSSDTTAYRNALFAYLQVRFKDNPMETFLKNSDAVSPLYHALRDRTLTPGQFDTLGFTHEKALAAINQLDKNDFASIDKQSTITRTTGAASYGAVNLELLAMRLASFDLLDCLDSIDTQALPAQIAAHQITPNWALPEGYAPIDTTMAAGLFDFGWCDLRTTRAALWILKTLDKLDAIDRDACVEGILRFHQGNGEFRKGVRTEPWIAIHGNEEDTFYALESLYMLAALDRIPNLNRWRYSPITATRSTNGKKDYNAVTGQTVVHWAFQLRLQEIRGY